MSFFFLFTSTKLENRRAEQVLPKDGEVGTSGRGEGMGKGGKRMNMIRKMCTHVCKCENDTC
jgi:hypothetical protein